jgi:hypothetical protein
MTRRRNGRPSARAFLKVALVVLTSACVHTSQSPEEDVVSAIRGGDVSLLLSDGDERDGELLAVVDSAFVILDGARVVVAPRPSVLLIDFGFTRIELPPDGLSARDRETLVRRSRFPYGMSSAALNALLQAANQRAPEIVRTIRP